MVRLEGCGGSELLNRWIGHLRLHDCVVFTLVFRVLVSGMRLLLQIVFEMYPLQPLASPSRAYSTRLVTI